MFNGEVINADSMQMYSGAPVITNKHPTDEREGIPHHVMNHVPWDQEYFTHRFAQEAGDAIQDIHSRGKLPIIVGGTHYYLNSLLFSNKTIVKDQSVVLSREQKEILDGPHERVFQELQRNDPQVAQKFHPNDTRRIRRALEIYYTTNRRASQHYDIQTKSSEEESTLKYDTLPLWLFAHKPQLNERLDTRVDKMLGQGGLDEIKELFGYYSAMKEKNIERGVWQVIGFKEFLPWLESEPRDDALLKECIDAMKAHTRQYAKKQAKWIKTSLAVDLKCEEQHGYINGGKLHVLDATDLEHWQKNVLQRGEAITREFLEGKHTLEQTPASLRDLIQLEQEDRTAQWKHITCPVCRNPDNSQLVIVGDKQYDIHLKSKRHRSNLQRGQKIRAYEEWLKH